jgi:nucleoside 2-deoxyribosyltransferase
MTSGEIIDRALARVKESDAILAIQQGDEKSEGLLLEVGYAKALGKKVVLAISNEAQRPFLRAIADQIIEFKTLEEFAEGAKQAF